MKSKIFILSIAVSSLLAESFELGKIEVTEKTEINKANIITSIDDSLMRDFERKTLVEALNLLPGITIQNGAGRNEQMVFVRGFDVKHAPLFIDGIPVAVPYDGYVDFSRFMTFDLSQIEVSKGFTPAILGPNTFAGAINMVTKKPTREFEGEIGAGVFSGNGKEGYAILGTNQRSFYALLSLSEIKKDNFPLSKDFPDGAKYEDGNSRDNSYSRDSKINVKFAYTPNQKDEYAINYIKQSANKGVPPYAGVIDGKLVKDSNPNLTGGGYVHFWKWDYWDKESLYFLSKTEFMDWYLKTRLFYDRFENSLSMYTNNSYTTLSPGSAANKPSSNPSWYDDNTKGGSLEIGHKMSPNDTLKAALHYRVDTHKEGSTNGWTKAQNPTYEMQNTLKSVAAEYTHIFSPIYKVLLGAREDWQNVNKANNTNPNDATYGPEFRHTNKSAFNPQAALFITPSISTNIWLTFNRSSRFPSIKDMFSYRMGMAKPNPDLTAEKITNWEIGAKQIFTKELMASVNIFYSKIDDYIQQNWLNSTIYQLQNIGKITQKGAEISVSYLPIDTFMFDVSYTRIFIKNESSSTPITQIPDTKLFVSATYMPTFRISWINSIEYASDFLDSVGGTFVPLSGYAKYNTKVIYKHTNNLSFDVGINNVFDRNYYLSYGYPEPGRVYFANLRYKF